VKILLQGFQDSDRHLTKTYGHTLPEVFGTSASVLGGKLELLVVPEQFMCALYHYQVRHAVSIPIGLMSSEEKDIRTAEEVLKRLTQAPAKLSTLTKGAPAAATVFRA
jgi:hypothetical protein